MQPDAEQARTVAPGAMDAEMMPHVQSGRNDTGLELADTGPGLAGPDDDPQPLHAFQLCAKECRTDHTSHGAESADDAQCELRHLRELAEEHQTLYVALELKRLKSQKCKLEREVHSLTWSNNDLRTKLEVALARSHSDAMAHPEVQAICAENKSLQLEKCKLQEVVARQAKRNGAQAANDSPNANTRPAKSLKGTLRHRRRRLRGFPNMPPYS